MPKRRCFSPAFGCDSDDRSSPKQYANADEKFASAHTTGESPLNTPSSVRFSAARPVIKMTQPTYVAVMSDLARKPFRTELGGILLGPIDAQDVVVRYLKDHRGDATPASFTIDHNGLTTAIRNSKPAGLTCVGIVHSHPNGICRPSGGDLAFLDRIFANPKNSDCGCFFFPIVCNGTLYPFVVDTTDVRRVLTAEVVLI